MTYFGPDPTYRFTREHLAWIGTDDDEPDPHDDHIQDIAHDSDDWRTQQETTP